MTASLASMACLIICRVPSSDRRRVDGDVIVVPSDDCRECPLRKGAPAGDTGDDGEAIMGEPGVDILLRDGVSGEDGEGGASVVIAVESELFISEKGEPDGMTPDIGEPIGDMGLGAKSSMPSTSAASYSSGGRRSFSISLLRASPNEVIVSLMPSAPSASASDGNFDEPATDLSSELPSDSSRNTAKTRDILPTARILFLMTARLSATSSTVRTH